MSNIFEMVKFNADGLVPAVAQDIRTDEVLMLAYMNEESLTKTIETGKVHYFSRSRQKLWLKGETSGHFQQVRSISVDCDGDTLLLKVEQNGTACHTGHRSCFFTRMDLEALKNGAMREDSLVPEAKSCACVEAGNPGTGNARVGDDNSVAPAGGNPDACVTGLTAVERAGAEVLQKVFGVISDRRLNPKEGSYTNYLFGKGLDKILKKVGEEACEVVIASKNGSRDEIKAEIADLLYHVMVLLAERDMTLEDIYDELKQRE